TCPIASSCGAPTVRMSSSGCSRALSTCSSRAPSTRRRRANIRTAHLAVQRQPHLVGQQIVNLRRAKFVGRPLPSLQVSTILRMELCPLLRVCLPTHNWQEDDMGRGLLLWLIGIPIPIIIIVWLLGGLHG